MNTNLEIYAVQSISQKLCKKVLTRKCITATTSTIENELELLAFCWHTVCLPQYDQNRLSQQPYSFLYLKSVAKATDLTYANLYTTE